MPNRVTLLVLLSPLMRLEQKNPSKTLKLAITQQQLKLSTVDTWMTSPQTQREGTTTTI